MSADRPPRPEPHQPVNPGQPSETGWRSSGRALNQDALLDQDALVELVRLVSDDEVPVYHGEPGLNYWNLTKLPPLLQLSNGQAALVRRIVKGAP